MMDYLFSQLINGVCNEMVRIDGSVSHFMCYQV